MDSPIRTQPTSAQPPVIGTTQPIVRHKNRRWVTIMILAAMAAASLLAYSHFRQREKALASVHHLFALKYPSQLDQARRFCTAQGFRMLPEFATDSGKLWLAAFRIGEIKSNPGVCDVELLLDTAEGKWQLYLRLLNEDGWKFDDVYVVQVKGREIKRTASYMIEHPALSFAEINSDKIVDGINSAADFVNAVRRLGNALDNSSDSRQGEAPTE